MRQFNVKVNGKSYNVEVEEIGEKTNTSAPVIKESAVQAVPVQAAGGGTNVKSPLPGLILNLLYSDGAAVKKNDKILVLEAMKMENDIIASCDGTIYFNIRKGDTVETGAVLAVIK